MTRTPHDIAAEIEGLACDSDQVDIVWFREFSEAAGGPAWFRNAGPRLRDLCQEIARARSLLPEAAAALRARPVEQASPTLDDLGSLIADAESMIAEGRIMESDREWVCKVYLPRLVAALRAWPGRDEVERRLWRLYNREGDETVADLLRDLCGPEEGR